MAGGPTCAAPAGLCFDGKIKGDIKGTIEGDVNSLTPTLQPDVSLADATRDDSHEARQSALRP